MPLTSYFYIKRFVKDQYYAGDRLDPLRLFRLCGVQHLFNHFHEVIVFFPSCSSGWRAGNKLTAKGCFLPIPQWPSTAWSTNWFFIGEVLFVVLYVFIRMADRDWGMTVKKFITLAF